MLYCKSCGDFITNAYVTDITYDEKERIILPVVYHVQCYLCKRYPDSIKDIRKIIVKDIER